MDLTGRFPPVVIGVNGTPLADAAAHVGVDEARRRLLPVRLVRAFDWPISAAAGEPFQAGREASRRAASTELSQLRDALMPEYPGGRIPTAVVDGPAAAVLVTESAPATLLVLGARGEGRPAEVLGPVVAAVVRRSACPVLSAAATARRHDEAPVVVGVTDSAGDEAAVRHLLAAALLEAATRSSDLVVADLRSQAAGAPPVVPLTPEVRGHGPVRALFADRPLPRDASVLTRRERISLRVAADRARLAPSVHNTQPWRFQLLRDRLEVRLDPSRRLPIDPHGRELVMSAGAALLNARVGRTAVHHACSVSRFPDPTRPDLAAVVQPAPGAPDPELAALDPVVPLRRSSRTEFAGPAPVEVTDRLGALAGTEGARLVRLAGPQCQILARVTAAARAVQDCDERYVHELAAWTPDRLGRGTVSRSSRRGPPGPGQESCRCTTSPPGTPPAPQPRMPRPIRRPCSSWRPGATNRSTGSAPRRRWSRSFWKSYVSDDRPNWSPSRSRCPRRGSRCNSSCPLGSFPTDDLHNERTAP